MATLIYLKHHNIDFERWDACLAASSNYLIYAKANYLSADCPTWEAIVTVNEDGKYETILPIPARQKMGIRYVSQPYFCQQLAVFSRLETVPASFLNEALLLLQQRFWYCNRYFLSLEKIQFQDSHFQQNTELQIKSYFSHLLPLNKPYEELLDNFTNDRKQNLRRAQNAGWTMVPSKRFEDLVALHQAHNELKAVGRNLNFDAYKPYIVLVNKLLIEGKARLVFAQKNGINEAGCLFVFSGNRIIYLFNGASQMGRKQHGRLLIINEVIKQYAGKNYIFDFEDPFDASEVSAYYATFGSLKEPYVGFEWTRLPPIARWLLKLRRRFL